MMAATPRKSAPSRYILCVMSTTPILSRSRSRLSSILDLESRSRFLNAVLDLESRSRFLNTVLDLDSLI